MHNDLNPLLPSDLSEYHRVRGEKGRMTGLSKVTLSDNSIGTLGFLCPSPPERIHTHLKKRILSPERLTSMIRECSCEVISYFVRKGFVFVAVFQIEGRLSFPATALAQGLARLSPGRLLGRQAPGHFSNHPFLCLCPGSFGSDLASLSLAGLKDLRILS